MISNICKIYGQFNSFILFGSDSLSNYRKYDLWDPLNNTIRITDGDICGSLDFNADQVSDLILFNFYPYDTYMEIGTFNIVFGDAELFNRDSITIISDTTNSFRIKWKPIYIPITSATTGDFDADGLEDLFIGIPNNWVMYQGYIFWGKNIVSSIKNPNRDVIPEGYKVSLYPNPFNSVTTIDFTLKEAGRIGISIYNILGQEVAVLVDGEMPAGSHKVQWDGRDGAGTPVGSGVYICRMTAGNAIRTMKMLLLK